MAPDTVDDHSNMCVLRIEQDMKHKLRTEIDNTLNHVKQTAMLKFYIDTLPYSVVLENPPGSQCS